MLKFEGKFKEGDVIRSMDCCSSRDSFIEGVIIKLHDGSETNGVKCIEFVATRRVLNGEEIPKVIGERIFTALEISFMEFDDRITLVNNKEAA